MEAVQNGVYKHLTGAFSSSQAKFMRGIHLIEAVGFYKAQYGTYPYFIHLIPFEVFSFDGYTIFLLLKSSLWALVCDV